MPKTIMIVDDYVDVREMMKIIIQQYGYDVIEAKDGTEAVEKFLQFHPDLILMDLVLPKMDGETATKIIRHMEGSNKISIIALTGYGNTSFDQAKASGFNAVLVKPLKFETLELFLNQYLS